MQNHIRTKGWHGGMTSRQRLRIAGAKRVDVQPAAVHVREAVNAMKNRPGGFAALSPLNNFKEIGL